MTRLLPLMLAFLLASVARSEVAGTTPTTQVKTVADLVALGIPLVSTRLTALVTGRTTANDGYGGAFFYDASSSVATNPGTVFKPTVGSGRWIRQEQTPLNVGWFGAVGDGVTDATEAFRAAFAVISTRGGGKVELGNHLTYNVGSVTNSYPFYDFQNCFGLTIDGNGSTLYTGTGTNFGTFFQFTSCGNVVVRNLQMKSGYAALDNLRGQAWLVLRQGTFNFYGNNLICNGGVIGITSRGSIYTDGGTDANRVSNIKLTGFVSTNTYYPLDFQGAGDNFSASVKTRNSGRAYFASNTKNHEVVIDGAQGGPFSDVLLKAYSSTNTYSALENIKVTYNTNGRYPGSGNEVANDTLVQLEAQILNNSDLTNGSHSGFTNIDVTINYNGSSTDRDQGIFSIKKFLPDGTGDTSPRGHVINGLSVHGNWSGLENLLSFPFEIFGWANDNWTGDVAKNIHVDAVLHGDYNMASVVDGRPFTDTNAPSVVLDGAKGDGYLALVNFKANTYALLKNTRFTNINTDYENLTYLNGSTATGSVMTVQAFGGNIKLGGATTISNSLNVDGHTQILNHQLIVTDSDTPSTGEALVLRHSGGKQIIDASKFSGAFEPLSIQTSGSERILIDVGGLVSLFGNETINGGVLVISSSSTPLTGGTVLISHDGVNGIFEVSHYTGSDGVAMFRTGGANQMWLMPDGTLALTNKIRVNNDINGATLTLRNTGGAGHFLRQTSAGGAVTSAAIANGDLPSSGVTAGIYGNAAYNVQVTVNAQGIITAVTTNLVTLTNNTTLACSDTTSALTTGVGKQYWRAPFAFTLKDVRASVSTASTSGGPLAVNIKKNGTTIFSTKLTIDDNELTSVTAATAYVFSTTAIADDDLLTFDIDTAGTGAIGLQVKVFYTRP